MTRQDSNTNRNAPVASPLSYVGLRDREAFIQAGKDGFKNVCFRSYEFKDQYPPDAYYGTRYLILYCGKNVPRVLEAKIIEPEPS